MYETTHSTNEPNDAETHNLLLNDALYNQDHPAQGDDPFINNEQNNVAPPIMPLSGDKWCTRDNCKRLGVVLLLWFIVLTFISTLVCNAINLHLWITVYNQSKLDADCNHSWAAFTNNDYGEPSHLFVGTIILAVLGLVIYLFSLYLYFIQVFGQGNQLWNPYFGSRNCNCFIQVVWLLWVVLISIAWGYYFEYIFNVNSNCLHSSQIYQTTTWIDYFYLPFMIPVYAVCILTLLMGACRCFCCR